MVFDEVTIPGAFGSPFYYRRPDYAGRFVEISYLTRYKGRARPAVLEEKMPLLAKYYDSANVTLE